jgi:Concanavalin A-like lectin/glucanases superfamily/Putative Ig domain
MQFDGESSARIDAVDDAPFRLTNALTVEVWAKTTQAYGTGLLFQKTQSAGDSYSLSQVGDVWLWRVIGSFGTVDRWTAVTAADVGSWVHLVGTFDGTTTRLYKNGVLMQSHEAQGTLASGAGVARVGLLSNGGYAFSGSIDEVAVYGSALSSAQIGNHYALRTATSLVALQIQATDPDSDPLMYSATGLPPGLLIHPLTGLISGNPTCSGEYTVTVTVTDPGGLAASRTFTWTITTTVATNPHRPVVANPGNQTGPVTTCLQQECHESHVVAVPAGADVRNVTVVPNDLPSSVLPHTAFLRDGHSSGIHQADGIVQCVTVAIPALRREQSGINGIGCVESPRA